MHNSRGLSPEATARTSEGAPSSVSLPVDAQTLADTRRFFFVNCVGFSKQTGILSVKPKLAFLENVPNPLKRRTFMVASSTRSIEDSQASLLPDGVFGNDPLLLRLVMDSRLDESAPRWKSAGDEILDAIDRAQAEGWEW
jgi:hypothetical protein